MIVLWLSELITDYGLGNGASLLIYTNIVSSFPNLYKKIIFTNTENLTFFSVSIIILLIVASLFAIVLLQEGVRRIQLLSSKQLNQVDNKDSRLINTYIPLRLNQAGVMPIILTTTVLVLPSYINNLGILPVFDITTPAFLIFSKIFYWLAYFTLILLFS